MMLPKEEVVTTETAAPETKKDERSWIQEVEVAGDHLVARIKELVAEGNVRRLILRSPDNKVLFEVPLTAGVAVGGAVTVIAPVLAAVGALAALVANVKVEVIREPTEPT